MKNAKIKFLILLLGMGFALWCNKLLAGVKDGGKDGGNGGDAVVCFTKVSIANQVKDIIDSNTNVSIERKKDPLGNVLDNEILSVDFLDLYDLKNTNNPLSSEGPKLLELNGRNLADSLDFILNELSKRTQVGDELIKIKNENLRAYIPQLNWV
ncbi:MAG: hypothetical protein QE271_04060 [Bacteriovoracaceae bacterium]|nr:hypothetical protein [Bacteriovoracaceae bacterium]